MASEATEPLHITISPRCAGNPQGDGGLLESRVRLQFAPPLGDREFLSGIREGRLLASSASAAGACADPTLDLRVEFYYQVAAPFRSVATSCISLPLWVELVGAHAGQVRFATTLCRLDWARLTPDRLGVAAGLTLVLEPTPAATPPLTNAQADGGRASSAGSVVLHRRKWVG